MKRKHHLFFALVLAFSLLLSACNFTGNSSETTDSENAKGTDQTDKTSSSSSNEEETLNVYFKNDIPDMNPITTTDAISFSILNNVKEGLYRLDENNEPQPALAKSVDISDDGLTYKFTLRDGIKWSNGDPVTSEDFRNGWLLQMDPEIASGYSFILSDYIVNGEKYVKGKISGDQVGIKTPDDKTLIVKLKQPTPYFLSLMTFEKYFPIHKSFYKKAGDKFGLSADKLLYNGPYVLKSFSPASGAVLVKNDNYWDKENVDVEKIKAKVIKESSTALNLYKGGKLDFVRLSSEDVDTYKDSPNFGSKTTFRSYYVQFNLDNKAIGNVHIRKALQLSYDPKILANVILNNGSKPAYGLIPPGMSGADGKTFREIQGKIVTTNVEKAKQLWNKGVEELGFTPELKLLISDDSINKDTGTFLQSQWKKNLGIHVDLVTKPYSGRLQAMRDNKFQMVISAWGADYNDPMTFMDLWASPPSHFRGNFSNQQYDQLIKAAKQEGNEKKRMEKLLKAEDILLKQKAVLAPLYYKGFAYLQKENVKNLVYHPWGNPWDYKYAQIGK